MIVLSFAVVFGMTTYIWLEILLELKTINRFAKHQNQILENGIERIQKTD